MGKDFDSWNIVKKDINNHPPPSKLFFRQREIWWCALGLNIDVEMDGKHEQFERPVLIIKKINTLSVLIAPLTSVYRDHFYLYPLSTIASSVSISQVRTISIKRLLRKYTQISFKEYVHIIIRLKYLLDS